MYLSHKNSISQNNKCVFNEGLKGTDLNLYYIHNNITIALVIVLII